MWIPLGVCLFASVSFAPAVLAVELGQSCGQVSQLPRPNECEGPGAFPENGKWCVTLDGGNVCVPVAGFGERCGRDINMGCLLPEIGRGNDDLICSGGKCANADGVGTVCGMDADCVTTPTIAEYYGAGRCPQDASGERQCFRCVAGGGGEKRCRVNAQVTEDCGGRDKFSFAACLPGLVCDASVGDRGGACVFQNPPVGALGADCYQNGVVCRASENLHCTRTTPTTFMRSCARKVGLGEACDPDKRLYCNIPDEAVEQNPFVCVGGKCVEPPVEVGAPCNRAMGFNCDPTDECEEKSLFCQVVGAASGVFPTQNSERCVSKDIPVGQPCDAGPSGGATKLCVEGARCQGGRSFSGTCVAII
jgi:hypothetical protein